MDLSYQGEVLQKTEAKFVWWYLNVHSYNTDDAVGGDRLTAIVSENNSEMTK